MDTKTRYRSVIPENKRALSEWAKRESEHFTCPYQPVIKVKKWTAVRQNVASLSCKNYVAISPQRVYDFQEIFFIFSNIKWGIKRLAGKRTHFSCEDEIEKSVSRYLHLTSPGKSRNDANPWSSGWIFLSYPHTNDGLVYYIMWYAKNSPIMFGFANVVALQILQKKRKDDVRIKLSFFYIL